MVPAAGRCRTADSVLRGESSRVRSGVLDVVRRAGKFSPSLTCMVGGHGRGGKVLARALPSRAWRHPVVALTRYGGHATFPIGGVVGEPAGTTDGVRENRKYGAGSRFDVLVRPSRTATVVSVASSGRAFRRMSGLDRLRRDGRGRGREG